MSVALSTAFFAAFACGADAPAPNQAAIDSLGKSPSEVLGVYVFGRDKQTDAQQQQDEQDCFGQAKTKSGYEAKVAQTAPAAPTAKHGLIKGAARGAVVGTAVGAVAGDTGKGAAIGATTGAFAGQGSQAASKQAAANQSAAANAKIKSAALDDLKRAFSACLDARGYSSK